VILFAQDTGADAVNILWSGGQGELTGVTPRAWQASKRVGRSKRAGLIGDHCRSCQRAAANLDFVALEDSRLLANRADAVPIGGR